MAQHEEGERVHGEAAEIGETRSQTSCSCAEEMECHPVTWAVLKVWSRQVASSDFGFALISYNNTL